VITPSTVSATAYGFPAGSLTATRIEPASAVPNDEPRLDRLRDSPEMSPWSLSGKLDWTTLTDEVSMMPTPMPVNNRPGIQLRMPECARTRPSNSAVPTTVRKKPAMISDRCERRFASRSAAADAARMPIVAGVSSSPVLTAL